MKQEDVATLIPDQDIRKRGQTKSFFRKKNEEGYFLLIQKEKITITIVNILAHLIL